MNKSILIEALPLHKEICSFLIDNLITFHCYNGGLKAIQITSFAPYQKNEFMNEIIKKFNLEIFRETKESVVYHNKTGM